MGKIIGIDLGTTNSVVSIMEGGSPVVIPTAEGGNTCPSVVAFNQKGERLVGQPAKRQAVVNPENSIYSIKRLMGRRYEDPETNRTTSMVPYQIVEGPAGDARVRIPVVNKTFTPQEISAIILQKLKRDAEAYLGEPVSEAVITVPAYFNDSQRQATKDAGRVAGLDVKRIINEPTAAALAYGLDKKNDQTILVFDLGGGTFDVSVLEVGGGVVEVKSTNGDTHLGGDDWDERIVEWLVDGFRKETGMDLRKEKQALQRMREAAEKAKVELSTLLETEINLPYITADSTGPKHLVQKLSRSRFEELTESLVERCRKPFENALLDANLPVGSLDEVILVGGATRMPMIQNLVSSLTGKAPNKSVNPDEVVSVGAAIQGGVLGGEVKDMLLLDVTPLSLGLETLGGVMTTLIPRNTTIPARKTETFSTADDNQPGVDIHILQGERPMAGDNKTLGNFRLDGIPAARRGIPQIEVTFDIDANGILNVSARDKASGKEQKIAITASTNLSESDVKQMVDQAKQHEAEDQKRHELAETNNMADQVIYGVQKTLAELNGQVSSQERSQVEDMIVDLKTAMESSNLDQMHSLVQQLQQAGAALAKQPAGSTPEAGGSSEAGGSENVVDGSFEKI